MTIWTEDEAGSVVADRWASRAFERAHAYQQIETQAGAEQGGEQRDYGGPWGPYADGTIPPPGWDGVGVDANGYAPLGIPPMTETRALQHGTVMACISLLSDTGIQTPLETFRQTRSGDLEKIDDPQCVANPNPELYDFDFFHQTFESLIGSGNSYNRVLETDRMGYPTSLLPVHPDTVRVSRNKTTGRREYMIGGGYVRQPETILGDGAQREMIHIPGFTTPGSLCGLNRIGKAMVTIYSGLAAEQYGALWFRDSANPSSVLQSKEPLGSETVKEVQKSWIKSHRGRRLPAVLNGFEWKPITISPEESQFLETQKWSTTQIARWWRCPPHLIGDVDKTTSWGTGIEEQTLGYIVYGMNPYYVRVEKVWSTLVPRGQKMKFNVDHLLRGRTIDRYMSYVHARNAGWLNVDEIRKKEGLPPVPGGGGKTYIQPLNMGPLGSDPTKITPDPKPADPTAPPPEDGNQDA